MHATFRFTRSKNIFFCTLFLLGASGMASQAQALDAGLVAGSAVDDDVAKVGLVLGWDHSAEPLWQGRNWHLDLRHEVTASQWLVKQHKDVFEVGYSPVLRLYRNTPPEQGRFFAETSIGLRLLSRTQVTADKTVSTAFQFSDMIGVGYQWGQNARHTVGLRYQHISNASIKKPNPGVNFGVLYYQQSF